MDDAFRLAAQSPRAYFGFLAAPVALMSVIAAVAAWFLLREWLSHGFIPLLAERNHYPTEIVAALRHVSAAEIVGIAASVAAFGAALCAYLAAVVLQVRLYRREERLTARFFRASRREGLHIVRATGLVLKALPRNFTLVALSGLVLLLPAVIAWLPAGLLALAWSADAESVLSGEPSALTPAFHAAFAACTACGAAFSGFFAAWQIWAAALRGKLFPADAAESTEK